MRFAAGLVVGLLMGGAAGGAAVYYVMTHRQEVVTVTPPPQPPEKPPERPTRPKRKAPRAPETEKVATDPTIVLSPADQKMVSAGDSLKVEETLDMNAESRELSSDEIEGTLGQQTQALLHCLAESRGAAPVVGRVVFGVIVDGQGRVQRTRVEAPAYLVKHGLYECARRPLAGLRFPAAGRQTTVTVPYDVTE